MKKITLTLMLLALVGFSSDLCAKAKKAKSASNTKQSSMMGGMLDKAKQMGASAAEKMK